MPLFGGITGFLDKYLLGYALGTASGPSLEPFVQDLANEAWKLNQARPLDPEALAAIVAEDVEKQAWGTDEASLTGVDATRFDALLGEALNAPGIGELFELWRRGLISDAQLTHGFRKAKLEPQWDTALEGLRNVLLSSPELAMAQQQGFVDEARSNDEAALQGVTNERQQIRFELSGLPPGVETALAMLRRGIIDQATFAQIVREGHTKTKYTGVLTEMERQLLSAGTAVRAHLKGHIDAAAMHSRGAQWGYTADDMDLWYLSEGRPATAHQIHIGYARGASLPGAANELDAIAIATKQSDVRPEYTEIIQAGRFSYPSGFQIRGEAQAGNLTEAQTEELLLEVGWKPQWATHFAQSWTGGAAGTPTDPHIASEQTRLRSTTHRSYIANLISDADATAALETAGVAAASVPTILTIWQAERSLRRKQLTAPQIRKAYKEAVVNPATGTAWTYDEALAALIELGYPNDKAVTLLGE